MPHKELWACLPCSRSTPHVSCGAAKWSGARNQRLTFGGRAAELHMEQRRGFGTPNAQEQPIVVLARYSLVVAKRGPGYNTGKKKWSLAISMKF